MSAIVVIVPLDPILQVMGLTEAYNALSHSIAGSAVLGGALTAPAVAGGALYQTAYRTIAPIGTS